ncbi:hypothetical protein Cgig2_013900 [Carnegiea gigantea]|uniref:Uncharacterized protein n=1 Tax=Carnegiea gigantea TaxID=171969 RepID=A0A9Q1JWD7_9CARY|nr:hypothetical protein Cgig2_013900 [Carnegiea gigantea]
MNALLIELCSSYELGKLKSKCWPRRKGTDSNSIIPEPQSITSSPSPPPLPPPPPRRVRSSTTTLPPLPIPTLKPTQQPHPPSASVAAESTKLSQVEKEETKHAYNPAVATAKAAEATVAVAQAAAEVVCLTTATHSDKSKQEVAAIKIQTAFRGYLARRALRVLRGLKRLQTRMQGQAIKRQTMNTLKTMQTLAQMQSEVRERRLRMAEENLVHQKLIQQKHAKELARQEHEKSQKTADDWDSSRITKEQIQANLQSRHEAATRRERTLAYSYTHQQTWKSAARSATTMFMDQNNPHWGWSWMERWLASRPWETVNMTKKDSSNNDYPRLKASKFTLVKKEMTKSYAQYHNSEKPPPSIQKQTHSTIGRLSSSSAPSKSVSSPVAARKLRSQTPRASPKASMWGPDEDVKSMVSKRPGHSRRNSCSSAKDDNESLGSSQTVPGYMAPTESAKARSRSVTPDRSSVTSVKKGSSYTPSPTRSRRSTSSTADAHSISEHS